MARTVELRCHHCCLTAADSPLPCVYVTWQVRLGGCKGVLSRNSQLSGKSIVVRNSMDKFGSQHPQLEVCAVAQWLPAYLNRQVIMMMEFNGVPGQVRLREAHGRQLAAFFKYVYRKSFACCATAEPAFSGCGGSAGDLMLTQLSYSTVE